MITVDELRKNLESDFDLVCFVDLADVRSKHRNIFDIFTRHHREEYLPSDRLIFYSSHDPEQTFLNHIQYAAAKIDISNFFILFICPYDLKNKLVIANKNHGHDKVVMQNLVCDLKPTRPFESAAFADRSFLCPLPFMSAEVGLAGDVRPCCKYQEACGNLKEQPLLSVFNGRAYTDIRSQMIKGEVPAGCATCVSLEKLGSTSFRQLMTEKYENILDRSLVDSPSVVDITISPTALCNFKCRICGPFSSTSIRSEELRFATTKEEKNKIKKIYQNQDESHFVSIFSDPDLSPEFLHILGGEPFMWPKLPVIIDQLISNGNSKIMHLEFNTNGSMYPEYFENIVENFKSVEILISIDAVEERFELQRGGSWSEILENLKKFSHHATRDSVSIKLAPTINIQNLLYLDDVIDLAAEHGAGIVWCYLESPSYLCIDNITAAVKQKIQDLYKNHPVQELRNIAHRVMLSAPTDGQSFLDYIGKIDQRRNQDFSRFHQEICKLMKSQV